MLQRPITSSYEAAAVSLHFGKLPLARQILNPSLSPVFAKELIITVFEND